MDRDADGGCGAQDADMRVIGIDGCRKGWVGIVADDGHVEALFSRQIDGLVADAGAVSAIAIDIPIGLPDQGVREADLAARAMLGRLASSVFVTPVRAALAAAPYSEAAAVAVRLTGSGISQQAYRLREKIFEVERWLPGSPAPVWEVHPEISFAVANGALLGYSKHTWAGGQERRLILARHGLALDGPLLPAGGQAGADDVLDAAIAAWSARRLAGGGGQSLPARPEVTREGRPMAIWA
jgi:predicted RNase H-like nuclease